jgi:hypothetical protein
LTKYIDKSEETIKALKHELDEKSQNLNEKK